MKKTKTYLIIILSLVLLNIFNFTNILAVEGNGMTIVSGGLDSSAEGAGLAGGTKDPRVIVTNIIGYILAFIGIIIFTNIILAGYTWITAGGNEEAITKSKDKIKNSIIGLIVILAAYAITSTVFTLLQDVVIQ